MNAEHVTVDMQDTENCSQGDAMKFVEQNALAEDLEGSIVPTAQSKPTQTKHNTGLAADFLTKRGFGWMVDEDVGEEELAPLLEELDIDVSDIYLKIKSVLLPHPILNKHPRNIRENSDFWGPLVTVLLFSLVSLYGQFSVLSWIMTIWLFGSALIFVLTRVLGGDVFYSQCLAVIGYSVLPLTVIGVILPFTKSLYYLNQSLKMVGIIWSTYSCSIQLSINQLESKRVLLLYPLFLLYVYLFSLYSGV